MESKKQELNLELDDYIEDVADLFKILGDKTRTKILSVLQKGEANVSTISELVGLPISAISHQLRTLRQAKLIKPTKVGKEVFYSLDDEHVSLIFECALAHVKE
ncbi:MAG: metalloregulator ArsR/SmtB family transcription factor [Bacilli bacterium]|nr:metalloregulator ArsR/SmtB family transcription factor [Bacilli bacterium]